MRLGGDFEIIPELFIAQKNMSINFINQKNMIWTDLGRSAIKLAVEDILNRQSKKHVYLPIYVCSSVIKSFEELEFEIEYYSMGENLNQPNLENIIIEENSIFLFVNYFGLENPIYKLLVEQKSKIDFYIIEDNVQAAFSIFQHQVSDYKIYSFRKFVCQPDGALVISKKELIKRPALGEINKEFVRDQIYGKILRNEVSMTDNYLSLLKKSESKLDNQKIIPRKISDISLFIMERQDIQEISDKRKENWLFLLNEINKNIYLKKHVHYILNRLKNNEVPLGFPIIVDCKIRDELLTKMREKNIFCPVHWNINNYPNNENKKFEIDFDISKKIITLPIDQRISKKHLSYLIDSLEEILRSIFKK